MTFLLFPTGRFRRFTTWLASFLVPAFLIAFPASSALFAQDGEGDAPPFDPTGWETCEEYLLIGDPNARRVDGSQFTYVMASFPVTLRTHGPNANSAVTRSIMHPLMYESMIGIHSETEEFIPGLASHWKIEKDEESQTQTFWFHLDPEARWSDGTPVTAQDVYASWWHRVQEDREDPSTRMTFWEGYHEPELIDDLTIKVRTKKLNWRLFLYFGGMAIYPSKYIRVPGGEYLEKYDWELMPGSGPYVMDPAELKKGDSVTFTRRDDWWAEEKRWAQYTYNFDRIKFLVIRDREMEYEMFKKGELDYFVVGRAQRWVEDIPKEEIVQKGWVKRRKIYTQRPNGFSGLAFNMRKPPFDNKRVREAFSYLFNRERLMEHLFFNEYEFLRSYFPGRDWGNEEENPIVEYDPDYAAELLEEAGYTERDEEGWLIGPDGKRFELNFQFQYPSWERIWLVVKEDFEAAGIKFNLELLDPAALMKKITERQFTLHFQGWTALLFPNPETSWRSDLADKKANNNITGYKNERVDELLKEYNVTFKRAEQKRITREIDSLVFNEYPYALGWYGPFTRILYWDKFGHPENYLNRIEYIADSIMMQTWWWEPEREQAMLQAREAGKELPQGEVMVEPWKK